MPPNDVPLGLLGPKLPQPPQHQRTLKARFNRMMEMLLYFLMQDWQEQVKIHFFREGLHPEVAQRAMVTAEPTSLAGRYSGKEAGESLYARQRRLGLWLSCGGEGHKAAMCPSKKPDPPIVPTSGAAKAGTAKGPEKKFPFKKGSGLQVELRKASLASEEAGGPESSEESVGNDSNLA
uniref:Uncharacterized protein n=1 Tax=Sphaerodactylus townsendi TaxID=933632 RepID=A0ACB8FSW2_9SAUR